MFLIFGLCDMGGIDSMVSKNFQYARISIQNNRSYGKCML